MVWYCQEFNYHTLCRGKHFRTNIGGLRAFFDVPVMALSASAPKSIQIAITESLKLNSPVIEPAKYILLRKCGQGPSCVLYTIPHMSVVSCCDFDFREI